jgi:hypothetical protein
MAKKVEGRAKGAPSVPAGTPAPLTPGDAGGVAGAVCLVLGTALLALFVVRFHEPVELVGRYGWPLAAAVVVLLAALACGHLGLAGARRVLARQAGLDDRPAPPDPAATLLVGASLLGSVLGLLAWPGVQARALVVAATAVLAVAGAALLWRGRPSVGPLPRAGALLLLAPPVAVAVLLALAPVASPDELIYKLAVPKEWLLRGGMVELPLNSHSYFATALSTVAMAALAFSGGVAAKLVHVGLYLAALAALHRLGERLAPGAGTAAAVAFAWTPALAAIAGWAWSEWALVGLVAVACEAWLALRDAPAAAPAARLALALGGAAAVKATALPVILGLAAAAFLARECLPPRRRGALVALLAAGIAVAGGVFYLRNLVWTGSPLAPFGLPDAPKVESFRSAGELSPLAELLRGYDVFNGEMADDSLGVLLPLAVVLAPLAARRRGAGRDLVVAGGVALVVLLVPAPMSRLLAPALVPLVAAAAALAVGVWATQGPPRRAALTAVAAVTLAAQAQLALWVVAEFDLSDVALGREETADYVARHQPYARAYAWMGERLPAGATVLCIGESRTYDLPRRAIATGNLDGPRMARWLAQAPDAAALARQAAVAGATHVLLHRPFVVVTDVPLVALSPLQRELVLELPPATWSRLQAMLATHATSVYRDEGYEVYELRQ